MKKNHIRYYLSGFFGVFFICFLGFNYFQHYKSMKKDAVHPYTFATNQDYSYMAPDYSIDVLDDGTASINIKEEGYFSYSVPGYPNLPSRIFRISLDSSVDEGSVSLDYTGTVTSLGFYEIAELPELATRDIDTNVRKKAAKSDVYTRDEFFPQNQMEYLGCSTMRKWKIANINL